MLRNIRTIIFEAPDNCGKDTQIKLLTKYLACNSNVFHVLHYSAIPGMDPRSVRDFSRCLYTDMFRMILEERSDKSRIYILNRSHIGEDVYAPMYRKVDGSYIYDIENDFKYRSPLRWNEIVLITFIDAPMSLIGRDDGLSFSIDFNKKVEEIKRFCDATEKSNINHKKVISIAKKTPEVVHKEVVQFLEEIEHAN